MVADNTIKFLSSDVPKKNTTGYRDCLDIDLNNEDENDELKFFFKGRKIVICILIVVIFYCRVV